MLRAAGSAFAAAAIALGGLAAATSGPNLRGVLDRSGVESPACFPGEPCDPNPVGVFVVFSRERHKPVRVRVRSSYRADEQKHAAATGRGAVAS